jgi:epoxyqueuosine reductase
MISAEEIKNIILGLGADRCGIAPVERFEGAPEGFRPREVWSRARSVVVFLKQMPSEAIRAENPIPYSHTASLMYSTLDRIGLEFAVMMEKQGVRVVPVPTDTPYLHWEEDRKHGMGILSLRHAAYNAGLGILGRNTLLINRELGNMVYIGAVLTDAIIESDPVVDDFACPPGCTLCVDACPAEALDGITVNQKRCREISCIQHPRGWELYMCSQCRLVCPYRTGVE